MIMYHVSFDNADINKMEMIMKLIEVLKMIMILVNIMIAINCVHDLIVLKTIKLKMTDTAYKTFTKKKKPWKEWIKHLCYKFYQKWSWYFAILRHYMQICPATRFSNLLPDLTWLIYCRYDIKNYSFNQSTWFCCVYWRKRNDET